METLYESVKKLYQEHRQGHLFQFSDELSDQEKEQFANQLKEFDPKEINQIFAKVKKEEAEAANKKATLSPFPDVVKSDPKTSDSYRDVGLKKIAAGSVAALVLAGGQGTRLSSTQPKGLYDLQLLSNKTPFRIQAERILRLQNLATQQFPNGGKTVIPWYVMTSDATHNETVNYFEQNNFFGLLKENVTFFRQVKDSPCITPEGLLLLEKKTKIAVAPSGNGAVFSSLKKSGVLEDLKKRGVDTLFCYGIDNILVKVADPVFVGIFASKNYDSGVKVVPKAYPTESVGVVCLRDGKPGVVEYSEIDPKLASLVDPVTNQLVYNQANICIHLFTTSFLEKVADMDLPYHVAKKKIPAYDAVSQETRTPNAVNGWKLERFIFDVLEYTDNLLVYEVQRESDFAPLKNKNGVDSPETCREALSSLHKRYAREAGAVIEEPASDSSKDKEHDASLLFEISPLISYEGEGLTDLVLNKTFSCPKLIT